MKGGAGIALLLAILLVSPAAAAEAAASLVHPEVGRALLDEARQAADLGDWETAGACLDEAVFQDPGNSDILYLRALASIRLSRPYAAALGDLNAALGTGRFKLYSKREARILKAELLIRERRWAEALDALGSPGGGSSANPAYSLARAKALIGAGNTRAFLSEIGEALRRFPDDGSFPRLLIAEAGKLPRSDAFLALGETILARLKRYAEADPELPVLAAPLMGDLSAQKDAVLAYRASGGSSPKASLRALEYGIIDEKAAAAELLAGQSVALDDLSSLLALAGSPEGRQTLHEALASWTGTVLVDADADGVYEGSFAIDKGIVRKWSRDSRQEGIVDEQAAFADGIPRELVLSRPDQEIHVVYSGYPAVSSLSFVRNLSSGEERISYAFGPEAFSFAPIELTVFSGSGRDSILFPRALGAEDPTERAAAAAALSVETIKDGKRELVTLDKGLPVSAVTYVGDRVFSTRSYEKGRPVLERVDVEGDGRFELEKVFAPERGAIKDDQPWPVAWIRIDADGDGVFEYREQTQFPFRKEWDFDGNGSVDARVEELPDGSFKGSFSSRLDGRLDEEVIVKGGRIVSISRDGIRLMMVGDSNRSLTWIGKKPFDLGNDMPVREGIYFRSGMRYRLIRVGACAFAELVP